MAKTLATGKIAVTDFKKVVTNFTRYAKDKRLSLVGTFIKGVRDKDIVRIPDDFNPGYIDPIAPGYDSFVAIKNGILIVVVVPVPIPFPRPGHGPCFRETVTKVFNAKDAKITRFTKQGIAHLVVESGKYKVEMITLPK